MAWASPKQYKILQSSEQGKQLLKQIAQMDQRTFQQRFNQLLQLLQNSGAAKAAGIKEGPQGAQKGAQGGGTPFRMQNMRAEQEGATEGEYERYVEFCRNAKLKPASKEGFESCSQFFRGTGK